MALCECKKCGGNLAAWEMWDADICKDCHQEEEEEKDVRLLRG